MVNFTVEITDIADAEISDAYLYFNRNNPDFAQRWLEGLLRAIDSLDTFPRSHQRVEEGIFDREVRRMIYRNGRTVYRVLFCIIDADDDGVEDTVRVLHVVHGARNSP